MTTYYFITWTYYVYLIILSQDTLMLFPIFCYFKHAATSITLQKLECTDDYVLTLNIEKQKCWIKGNPHFTLYYTLFPIIFERTKYCSHDFLQSLWPFFPILLHYFSLVFIPYGLIFPRVVSFCFFFSSSKNYKLKCLPEPRRYYKYVNCARCKTGSGRVMAS